MYRYLKQRGWKLIRIVCKSDKLYNDEKIAQLIEECKKYLSNGHSWIEIDIDNDLLRCKDFVEELTQVNFFFINIKKYFLINNLNLFKDYA